MNLFRSTTTTPIITNSINRLPLRRVFFFIPLVLACFTLSPRLQAQLPSPSPDGGYLGSNTAEGDGALASLTTDGGTVGVNNTAIGNFALSKNTTGNNNTATGVGALSGDNVLFNTGSDNTATGVTALNKNTTGTDNTAMGENALASNSTGSNNTATGLGALLSNLTGGANTATGVNALANNTSGSSNIAVGTSAGVNLITGSDNIDIGNAGVADESNTIRIGVQGTQTATYIAGVSGGAVTGMAVKVNAAGQVGTAPSSARFKEEIKPMDKASETILALKPVSFRYKKEIDPERTPQFGLVAEDVEKVDPALVARDAAGKPYTVRYDAVDAMLLNEFLKAHRQIEEQQKEIEALRALIQKVSDKVEMNKPSPQMALNSQ